MATGGGDRLPVNCGVNLSGNKFILSYKVGSDVKKKDVMWNWNREDKGYKAVLEVKTKNGNIKYHNSAVIDEETHSKLGDAEKSLDDGYYKVKLKKKSSDVPDLEQFFNVPQ